MSLDHVARVRAEAERFALVVEQGPLDAPIAACPGWTVRDLAGHLGFIHRWATAAIETAAMPTARPSAPEGASPAELAAWMRDGSAPLVAALAAIDPAGPTWHPFPAPLVAGLWPRRQDHETTLHRWDAEAAVGRLSPIDPEAASDGIDEYFELILGRVVSRESRAVPTSTFHVHCTDTDGEWLVWNEGGSVGMKREHAKGDAALRGPAEALLLRLWGRPVADGVLDTIGSTEAAASWLALGGA